MDAIEKKYGYPPTQIRAAIDILAVYVNKDNPIASLSLPEVDAIFSKTRKGGYPNDITTWGQLGLKGEWANKPISLYGRNSASGTYGFFKEHALFKGDYKDTVKEQPGSASVVQGVTEDLYGIGYSGIGYRTSGVRALPLAAKVGGQAVRADLRERAGQDVPAVALPLHLRRPRPAQADGPAHQGVPPLRAVAARARRSWSRTGSCRSRPPSSARSWRSSTDGASGDCR